MSQEVRENRAFFVASPREFPLSFWATFKGEFQIITQNYTPLSTLGFFSSQLLHCIYRYRIRREIG